MKRITITIQLLLVCLLSFASNWQKMYLPDEFGDADYSKPIYCLLVDPVGGYGAAVNFYYVNGVFAVDFTDAYVCLDDVVSMSVKSASGQVNQLEFEEIGHEPSQYGLSRSSSQILFRLLEEGNFSMSVKTPVPLHYGETHNHVFKIGNEGKGLGAISGTTPTTSKSGKPTFKGKIGEKYSITVQFDQPESVFENGGTLTGTYWYGNGTNGKMKLKGSVDGLGRIDMEEYDPSGKRCGEWYLNTLSSDDGMKYELEGVMINAKGQTFNVSLTQQ